MIVKDILFIYLNFIFFALFKLLIFMYLFDQFFKNYRLPKA